MRDRSTLGKHMNEKGIVRKMYKTPNSSKKLYRKRHVAFATLSNAALAMMLQTQHETFIVDNNLQTDPYLCFVRPRCVPYKATFGRRWSCTTYRKGSSIILSERTLCSVQCLGFVCSGVNLVWLCVVIRIDEASQVKVGALQDRRIKLAEV
jgi:hypothetical protein